MLIFKEKYDNVKKIMIKSINKSKTGRFIKKKSRLLKQVENTPLWKDLYNEIRL
jgi:hypothetical protein